MALYVLQKVDRMHFWQDMAIMASLATARAEVGAGLWLTKIILIYLQVSTSLCYLSIICNCQYCGPVPINLIHFELISEISIFKKKLSDMMGIIHLV